MYCARCRKVFGKLEKPTYAVLDGWNKPTPTCRDDRTCYEGDKLKKAIIIQPIVVVVRRKIKRPKIRDRLKEWNSEFVRPWK